MKYENDFYDGFTPGIQKLLWSWVREYGPTMWNMSRQSLIEYLYPIYKQGVLGWNTFQ